jgi:ABC-type phosphate/phosphonate transport system substrate-binding protein
MTQQPGGSRRLSRTPVTARRTHALRPVVAGVAAALVFAVCLVGVDAQGPQRAEPLHVAFTTAMFAGVNVNDAKAAIGVWAETIAHGRGLHLEPSTAVFDDVDELGKAMDSGKAHLVAMSVEQYRRLRRPQFGSILLGGRKGRYREEFLLLVRKGGATRLADLRGRTLTTVDGTGYDMAAAWLESILLAAGLDPATRHFGAVTTVTKPSRALLPVFFGQQDACLTNRYGYELMIELNPQLGTALTALATSPAMVHSIVVFDRRYAPASRAAVLEALFALHETPRGQQVLSMFGLDRLIEGTPEDLASPLDLLAQLDHLRGAGK